MSSESILKQSIMKAARSLFIKYGYKKTSVDEIAKRARIGKATIYTCFASKEEMFSAVVQDEMQQFLQELKDAVTQPIHPIEKIKIFLSTYRNHVLKLDELKEMSEEVLIEILPRGVTIAEEFFIQEVKILEEIFIEGQQIGVFHVKDPFRVAMAVMSGIKGGFLVHRLLNKVADKNEAFHETVKLFLKGLTSPDLEI